MFVSNAVVRGRWAGGALTASADLDTATFRYDLRAALSGAELERAPPALGAWAGMRARLTASGGLRGSLLGGAGGPVELDGRRWP